MLFFDVCQFHSHQTGKLSLPGLKKHVCAHYSSCHLDRLGHIREEKLEVVRASVRHKCKRVVGRPPCGVGVVNLSMVISELYNPDADYHKRKHGVSKWLSCITGLAAFCNDNLLSADAASGWIVHHCWDEALQGPCCSCEVA